MPQSRRLSGYRSFITCDHPKGVMESQRRKQKNLKIEGGEEQIYSKEMAIRRMKPLNLMVKLIGVEDVFSRSMPSSPGNQIGGVEKIVNQKKPESDLDDVLHSKKPDWRKRTAIQMIKAVKLRGFFKNSLVKRLSFGSDDRTLVRPLRFSCMNMEHPIIPKRRSELNLESDERLYNMRVRTKPLAQPCGNEEQNESIIEITDYVNDDFSPVETPLSASNECNTIETETCCEDEIKLKRTYGGESANDHPSHIDKSKKSIDHGNNMKALLMCNPGFVKSLEKLFDLKTNTNGGLQQTADEVITKILLDAATEAVQHLALQGTDSIIFRAYDYTSLDLVLDEVCDWIKNLQCFKTVGENDVSDDSLLLLVKGDMSSNRTWVWDKDWRSTRNGDEFEEIVREIEEMVLSGLIEEMLMKTNSVYCCAKCMYI